MQQDRVGRDDGQGPSNRRGYWAGEVGKAQSRYRRFTDAGDKVHDRYMLESASATGADLAQDRYNILYSTTETTKPSLYAQTPKVQAMKRHKDRENDDVTNATLLLEAIGQYALEECDYDGVMKNVIADYLLPGLGVAWVSYDAVVNPATNVPDDVSETEQNEALDFEGLRVEYVNYKDFLCGMGRTWAEVPWVGRRVYYDKIKAAKRFGSEKAAKLEYSYRIRDTSGNADNASNQGNQAVIYEIWHKDAKQVVWYSEDYSDDVLDQVDDPYRLRDFWPCPEPIRAVWNTKSFIPRAFYSQYKAQAEELDNITARVRWLTQALRVVGVYDASQPALQKVLEGQGNKMIPVDNWAAFAQSGGMQGAIQYVPIKEVADVLMNLLQQRDTVKNEVYEITGFSDIQRGISKASETLGAQQIKSDWATGRLKDMQKEVQRFCRDMIRIMVEIMAEHFSEPTLAVYAGFDPPPVTDEEQQAVAQYSVAKMQFMQQGQALRAPGVPAPQPPSPPPPTMQQQAIDGFRKVVSLIKSEKQRCAVIGIETDSTIAPDEQAERADRMQFISSAGAYLQQAGPMALQYPEMRGLLAGVLMFGIRSFRSARPLEKTFEDFEKKLNDAPPMPPPGQGGDDGKAAADASIQIAQAKAQSDQASAAADAEAAKYKVDTDAAIKREQMARDHDYRMAELGIRSREVSVKEHEFGLSQAEAIQDAQLAQADQAHSHAIEQTDQAHSQAMDQAGFAATRSDADRDFDAGREDADQAATEAEQAASATQNTP